MPPRSAFGPPAGKYADWPSQAKNSPQGLFFVAAQPPQEGAASGPAKPDPRRPLDDASPLLQSDVKRSARSACALACRDSASKKSLPSRVSSQRPCTWR